MPALSDAAIEVIVHHAWRFASPVSFTLLSHMGGAIRHRSDDETAFTGREAEFTININGAATQPDLYEQDRAWVREWFEALEPHSTGGGLRQLHGRRGRRTGPRRLRSREVRAPGSIEGDLRSRKRSTREPEHQARGRSREEREGRDSNPRSGESPLKRLAGARIRPLCHLPARERLQYTRRYWLFSLRATIVRSATKASISA